MNLEDVKELVKKEVPESSRGQVNHYLNLVSIQRDLLSVDKLKVGDTFFYKVAGGKSRPWVVLWVRKGLVGAATLTHHTTLANSHSTECRFWKDNVIGPTISVFEEERCLDAVYYPYTNLKHLKEVRQKISEMWG